MTTAVVAFANLTPTTPPLPGLTTCVRMTWTTVGDGGLPVGPQWVSGTDFDLPPAGTCTVSLRARASETTTAILLTRINPDSGDNTETDAQTTTTLTEDWQTITLTLTVPDGATTMRVALTTPDNPSGGTSAWVDFSALLIGTPGPWFDGNHQPTEVAA